MAGGQFKKGFDPRRNNLRVNGRFVSPKMFVGAATQTPSEFADELLAKAEYATRGLTDVVEDSCKRVEAGAKRNVRQSAPIHNAGAYRGIDYEVNDDGRDVWGEVGYNPKAYRPAYLGNLLEFGGGGDPSPPHWDLARALHDERERFAEDIADYGEALLETRWSVLQ